MIKKNLVNQKNPVLSTLDQKFEDAGVQTFSLEIFDVLPVKRKPGNMSLNSATVC